MTIFVYERNGFHPIGGSPREVFSEGAIKFLMGSADGTKV